MALDSIIETACVAECSIGLLAPPVEYWHLKSSFLRCHHLLWYQSLKKEICSIVIF